MRLNVRRPQEPSILFSRCLPRPPEQTNPLFENARIAQQTWDEDFANALDCAQSGGAGRASPIISDSAPSPPILISAPKYQTVV
jgi:hypothetical protein